MCLEMINISILFCPLSGKKIGKISTVLKSIICNLEKCWGDLVVISTMPLVLCPRVPPAPPPHIIGNHAEGYNNLGVLVVEVEGTKVLVYVINILSKMLKFT